MLTKIVNFSSFKLALQCISIHFYCSYTSLSAVATASADWGAFSNVTQITAWFGHCPLCSLLYILPCFGHWINCDNWQWFMQTLRTMLSRGSVIKAHNESLTDCLQSISAQVFSLGKHDPCLEVGTPEYKKLEMINSNWVTSVIKQYSHIICQSS